MLPAATIEREMSATSSKIDRPTIGLTPATFTKLARVCCDVVVGHFIRRAAIASLHELDNRALRDIGLRRTEFKAAVHGLIARSDWEQIS
jgi:uncharacterized protein YjiS (DUF1127 family)